MKPFDGGMWVGVTAGLGAEELHAAYDESGERMMHLQASVEDYDVFTRSLSIGPADERHELRPGRARATTATRSTVTSSRPSSNGRSRSSAASSTPSSAGSSTRARRSSRTAAHIRSTTRTPPPTSRSSSLHYYFPWAIRSLVAWCAFCTVTGRSMRLNQRTRDYFEVGDRDDLTYQEKLVRYAELSDAYFHADEFEEFCAVVLPHLDEVTVDYVESPELRRPDRHGDPPRGRARAAGGDDRALPRAHADLGRRRARLTQGAPTRSARRPPPRRRPSAGRRPPPSSRAT